MIGRGAASAALACAAWLAATAPSAGQAVTVLAGHPFPRNIVGAAADYSIPAVDRWAERLYAAALSQPSSRGGGRHTSRRSR
jgi:hypothetical protein